MALSSAALNALPYRKTATQSGLTAAEYRTQHRAHGESVRWWKAFSLGEEAADSEAGGLTYIEQALDEAVRVLIFQNQKEIAIEEFGLIPVGQTMISCLPDEIELARNDRVLLVDRTRIGRYALTPSGSTLELPHHYVSEITAIVGQGGSIDPSAYSLTDSVLSWTGDVPEGRVAIEYRYQPLYQWLGVQDKQAPLGSDGKRLPQIGALKEVKK